MNEKTQCPVVFLTEHVFSQLHGDFIFTFYERLISVFIQVEYSYAVIIILTSCGKVLDLLFFWVFTKMTDRIEPKSAVVFFLVEHRSDLSRS